MFVSSYNTYIQTDNSTKESRQRVEKPSSSTESFGEKLTQKTSLSNVSNSAAPIDYISRGQARSTKQELEFQKEQLKNSDKQAPQELKETISKFALHNSLNGAKNAYGTSDKIYSLLPKQTTTIDQTPVMDRNLPEEAYEAKELAMKHKMINTYIANENYYRVTA